MGSRTDELAPGNGFAVVGAMARPEVLEIG